MVSGHIYTAYKHKETHSEKFSTKCWESLSWKYHHFTTVANDHTYIEPLNNANIEILKARYPIFKISYALNIKPSKYSPGLMLVKAWVTKVKKQEIHKEFIRNLYSPREVHHLWSLFIQITKNKTGSCGRIKSLSKRPTNYLKQWLV